MIIDASGDKDSITVGSSLNNHEGYSFTVYPKPGRTAISFKTSLPDYEDPTGFYEIGTNGLKEGMELCLYHYSSKGNLLEVIKFTKVADKQPDHDAGWGIQYMVNEKLIAGKYTLIDSNNVETEVILTNDGKIEGHPIFKTFYIETDFNGGPVPTFDSFILNIDSKQMSWYSYKKEGEDIKLYETIGEEGEEKLGELKFTLIKK